MKLVKPIGPWYWMGVFWSQWNWVTIDWYLSSHPMGILLFFNNKYIDSEYDHLNNPSIRRQSKNISSPFYQMLLEQVEFFQCLVTVKFINTLASMLNQSALMINQYRRNKSDSNCFYVITIWVNICTQEMQIIK